MRRRLLMTKKDDIEYTYLTFLAKENCTFSFSGNGISYSRDGGETWTALAANTDSPTILRGNAIMWKGTMTPVEYDGIGTFSSTGRFDVEGNVMSLLFGDNYEGQTDLTGYDYAFASLFNECSSLTSVPSNLLPATTWADSCYANMFYGCTSLTAAPDLPATTLAEYCYLWMFCNCSSLTTVPDLPATTLVEGCYSMMFESCTSLTSIPSGLLPATTLAEGCYLNMFWECTSLVTVPSGLLPATTLADSCYQFMFYDCTSMTTAPDLPAATLVDYCYWGMFMDCRNLNSIKCLATDISATDCTLNWLSSVSSTGTFKKARSMSSWPRTVSGIPSGWTVRNV